MPRILSGPNAVSWDQWAGKLTPLWGVRRASCYGLWSSITRWRRWERLLFLSASFQCFGIISNILCLAGFALVRGRHLPAGQPAGGPMSVPGWSRSSPAGAGAISGHSATAHPRRPQHYLLPVRGDTHRSAHGQDSYVLNLHMQFYETDTESKLFFLIPAVFVFYKGADRASFPEAKLSSGDVWEETYQSKETGS